MTDELKDLPLEPHLAMANYINRRRREDGSAPHAILRYPEPLIFRMPEESGIGGTVPPHHSYPFSDTMLAQSSIGNGSVWMDRTFFDRSQYPGDSSPNNPGRVTVNLRILANYARKFKTLGRNPRSTACLPTDEEMDAFMRIFIPLVPSYYHDSPGLFLVEPFTNRGKLGLNADKVGNKDIYPLEAIMRHLSRQGIVDDPTVRDDPNDPDRTKFTVFNLVFSLLSAVGNYEILLSGLFVTGRRPKQIAEYYNGTFFFTGRKYTLFPYLLEAFGNAAIDWGVDRPDFDLGKCSVMLQLKYRTSMIMKGLSCIKAFLSDHPTFKHFYISQNDYQMITGYPELIKNFQTSHGLQVPQAAIDLARLIESSDTKKMLETYKDRRNLPEINHLSVSNFCTDIEPVLCRLPGSGKLPDFGLQRT